MHKKAQTFGASLTTLCAAAFGLLFAANAAIAQSSALPKADLQKTATKYEVRGVIPYGRNVRGELTLLGASSDAQAIVDALPVKEPPLDGFRVSIELSEPGPQVHRVVFASEDGIVAVLAPKSDGTYERLPVGAEATIRNPWLTRTGRVRAAAPDKPDETRATPQNSSSLDGNQPFDRRGFRLGMTLKSFRAMPHPDNKTAYSVCSTDKIAMKDFDYYSVKISGQFASAGVIKCSFFYKYRPDDTFASSASLILGNISANTDFYFARKDASSEYQLAWMATEGRSSVSSSVADLITRAVGQPSIKETTWRNAAGAVLPNLIYTWSNNVSAITLTSISYDVKNFDLEHSHTELKLLVSRRLDSLNEKAAKKL